MVTGSPTALQVTRTFLSYCSCMASRVAAPTWAPVIPALAEHAHVIAPDLLGHGGSDKPRADYSLGALAERAS